MSAFQSQIFRRYDSDAVEIPLLRMRLLFTFESLHLIFVRTTKLVRKLSRKSDHFFPPHRVGKAERLFDPNTKSYKSSFHSRQRSTATPFGSFRFMRKLGVSRTPLAVVEISHVF